jgi:hypothetical protein
VKKQAERQQAASKVALDQQERLAQELASTKANLSRTQSQAKTENILRAREKALQQVNDTLNELLNSNTSCLVFKPRTHIITVPAQQPLDLLWIFIFVVILSTVCYNCFTKDHDDKRRNDVNTEEVM